MKTNCSCKKNTQTTLRDSRYRGNSFFAPTSDGFLNRSENVKKSAVKLHKGANRNLFKVRPVTRAEFMTFFRSDDFHNTITPDDAAEIFVSVLHGSSDLEDGTLIREVLGNYGLSFSEVFPNCEDED